VYEDAANGGAAAAAAAILGGSTAAALRLVGSMSPASGLLGSTVGEAAVVDSWLQWTWSNVDLPCSTSDASLLEPALGHLDAHLTYRTYLVGDCITAADISVAASLERAAAAVAADQYPNLARWRSTVAQQSWWIQARATTKSADAPVTASASAAAASASRSAAATLPSSSSAAGVELNGPAPPVLNQKYRRPRLRIKELLGTDQGVSYEQQTVTVAGWARTIRKASAKLLFVELNDGSTGHSLQCVLDSTTMAGFDECKTNGGTGSSFQFTGVVVKSPGAEQAVDLNVTAGTLLGAVYGGNAEGTAVGGMLYPMSKKEHTLEHLRDVAHLRPRGQLHAAAMRVRHAMAYATHHFFHSHGFLYIHTPILTGADCEGAGEQFGVTTLLGNDPLKADVTLPLVEKKEMSKSELKRLEKQKAKADPTKPVVEEVPGAVDYKKDFFGQRVNLTVSGQLNVETHACALCDVYTFGPTFRAEESRTYRHLSEFWMIEPEIAFADLHQDINLAEDYLKYCVKFALENCADDLEFFEGSPHGEEGLRDRLRNVLDNEFKVRICIAGSSSCGKRLACGPPSLRKDDQHQWESL
jgi:aspartyl/asparaginyl-tRNA synthetase